MKKIILLLLCCCLLIGSYYAQAHTAAPRWANLVVQTSAQCGSCKDRLETGLKQMKGIKKVSLDLTSKKISVRYKPTQVSPEQIRTAITAIGYDADQLPAQPKAYQALPACCKKGGHDH